MQFREMRRRMHSRKNFLSWIYIIKNYFALMNIQASILEISVII